MTDKELQPDTAARHEQFTLPDVVPKEEIERVHDLIGSFAERYELPARIASALRPETALHFTIGLPQADEGFTKSYVDFVHSSLTVFDEDFEKIKQGNFEPIDLEADDNEGRLRRNILIPPAHASQTFDWEKTLLVSKNAPLYQSALICSMVESMHLSHFHIYERHSEFIETELRFNEKDFELLTGEPGRGEVKESVVARRLRELGLVDESKAQLDTRWELFNAVLQVELMRLIVHDIVDFGRISSHSRGRPLAQYTMLTTALSGLLYYDDLESKRHFLHQLPEIFSIAPQQAMHGSQVTRGLLIAERTRRLLGGLEDQFVAMNLVFEEQGFSAPESLTAVTPEVFLEERARREHEKLKELQEERQQIELQEKRERLVLHHASLLQQVEAANNPWLLSSKARKKMGLADFPKYLLHGFQAADRSQVTFAIPDEDRQNVLNVLIKLQQMADKAAQDKQGLDAVGADLAAAMQLQTALEARRDAFYEEARTLKVSNLMLPEILHLRVHIKQIVSQWDAFEKLIREKWPNDGDITAGQIKELLDGLE